MTDEGRKERSPGIKLLLASLTGFVLMIPLLMIYALVWDRQDQSHTAQTAINAGWGGPHRAGIDFLLELTFEQYLSRWRDVKCISETIVSAGSCRLLVCLA